jgi:hypothetical protein
MITDIKSALKTVVYKNRLVCIAVFYVVVPAEHQPEFSLAAVQDEINNPKVVLNSK